MKRVTEKPMIVICAWCSNAQVKTEEAWRMGLKVSHGICPSCVQKFETDMGKKEEAAGE